MTVERKGRAGTMRERVRVVCDSCGGSTHWVSPREMSAPDLAVANNMTVSDDGTRHVCAGCERKARVECAVESGRVGKMIAALGALGDVMPDPEESAMVKRKVGHPMIGAIVCLTGAMSVATREQVREYLRAMGIEVTSDPKLASYVVVGNTGRHGVTSKMRVGQESGAKVIPEDALWEATHAWKNGKTEEAKTIIDAEYTVVEHDDGSAEVTALDKRLPSGGAVITPAPGPNYGRPKSETMSPKKRRKAIDKLLVACDALLDELDEAKL